MTTREDFDRWDRINPGWHNVAPPDYQEKYRALVAKLYPNRIGRFGGLKPSEGAMLKTDYLRRPADGRWVHKDDYSAVGNL